MSRQDEIWTEMQALLPDAEPDRLAEMLDRIMQTYEIDRLASRDVMPTKPEMVQALKGIKGNLEAIARRFTEDDGLIIAGWLGAELDGKDEASTSYVHRVMELMDATGKALDQFEKPGIPYVSEQPHTRKTRTTARDRYLIPALTGLFMQMAIDPEELHDEIEPMVPSKEWGFIDSACRFVDLALEYAGIQAPDAGKDVERMGEPAQGRLRRAVKAAAQSLTDNGLIPPP